MENYQRQKWLKKQKQIQIESFEPGGTTNTVATTLPRFPYICINHFASSMAIKALRRKVGGY